MLAPLHSLRMLVIDLFKSRRRLEAQNLFLRHQLNTTLRRADGMSNPEYPSGRPEKAPPDKLIVGWQGSMKPTGRPARPSSTKRPVRDMSGGWSRSDGLQMRQAVSSHCFELTTAQRRAQQNYEFGWVSY
jgi:hypothetical protein